ncbi:hypothetical protein SAMN04488020_10446 [Palleronia marisminoris]|uniref:Histidine kinase n=1 Tax=Palleronia marisminoris TaxID=315423 RepID=A0A1Y5SF73_9RHOB|nr:DUF6446 family protein [Palleronia marisminoris]SFG80126.1 hypothetical protein SAMN04488020_10446 [Palleronia marisminoris]SLN39429.1 hypothetical protein PAM7066_01669 [Palleronia marisminoris]
MTGKIIAILLAVVTVVAALGLYYLQVYYFYERVSPRGFALQTEAGEIPAKATNIEAIDANSSPIRFRACFDTPLTPDVDAVPYEGAVPLNAPFWFDCFDAEEIGVALASAQAQAFLAEKNIEFGVDRVVAILPGGRGYVWHQLNNCGERAYDGTQIGEDCPPREDQ